jgi:hypothetical protein
MIVADEPVILVRYRSGVTHRTVCTVHLVPKSDWWEAGAVGTLCGALLTLDEVETVNPGEGVPCTACMVSQASAMAMVGELRRSDPERGDAGLGGLATYHTWGWPVTEHCDQIRLRLRHDASAIAIPVPLAVEVTQILTARYCVPAVLAHPDAPDYGIVLTGERFDAMLPWPTGVHQVVGTLALPPAMTPRGPITWMRSPHKDSLRLSREIDVFGALRTVLNRFQTGGQPLPDR